MGKNDGEKPKNKVYKILQIMKQLIDKDALVAEIKRYKHKADERLKIKGRSLAEERKDSALQNLCGNLIYFLDTLEVKEVDLEKELKEDWLFADKTEVDCLESMCLTEDMFVSLAKKYFQLGLKAVQKGEEI